MRLYTWLDRISPNSFVMKAFLIAFAGTHIPLLATCAFLVLSTDGPFPWGVVLVLLVATVFGAAFTLILLRLLLQPIVTTSRAANDYRETRAAPNLPRFYADEAGILMREFQALIEHSEEALAATARLSLVDPLTGLKNRRGFEAAARECQHAHQPGLLAMIDCDHFKAINDTFGHQVGDRMLQSVAAIIARTTRQDDIAARFGGDEFVVMMNGEPSDVEPVADRLRAALARIEVPGSARPMHCSVGMVRFSRDDSIEQAIAAADKALFAVKRNRPSGPQHWA